MGVQVPPRTLQDPLALASEGVLCFPSAEFAARAWFRGFECQGSDPWPGPGDGSAHRHGCGDRLVPSAAGAARGSGLRSLRLQRVGLVPPDELLGKRGHVQIECRSVLRAQVRGRGSHARVDELQSFIGFDVHATTPRARTTSAAIAIKRRDVRREMEGSDRGGNRGARTDAGDAGHESLGSGRSTAPDFGKHEGRVTDAVTRP